MIAVAIIATLAAIALPAYQGYTIRARVAEGLGFVSTAKLAVIENATAGQPLTNGYDPPDPTKNTSSVTIDATGTVTLVTSAIAGNGSIVFAPVPLPIPGAPVGDILQWTCNGGTLETRYRPAECR